MNFSRFYLGMNYNGGGIQVAKKLIPELEARTGHQCTSRWVWSEAHEGHDFRLTIAATDLADIARANYVILARLTKTARGCCCEEGMAIALDKPVYLYLAPDVEPIGFDSLCQPWKEEWLTRLNTVLSEIAEAQAAPEPSSASSSAAASEGS
jgi:nucleoside 2-deoxyribosyltransferase